MSPQPSVGVIYNARSHRNKGRTPGKTPSAAIDLAEPRTKADIPEALRRFAANGIDCLVISGGDGTVRDVLSLGRDIFTDGWPAIAVLPRGKTNALNADLGAPADWSLNEAVEAFVNGRRLKRRPLEIRSRMESESRTMFGFILGAGIFTLGVNSGQDAHRMGFFDSLAVGLTSLWGIGQTIFGSSKSSWRRGTVMRLTDAQTGVELPHSRYGEQGRRSILLASTLNRMPLGIKLFGKGQKGIRLAVLDAPRRRIMGFVPAMLAGWHPRWLDRGGLHHLSVEGFEMEIGDKFVLDGETFEAGSYVVMQGPHLSFVAP
ncbi:diacylglycerol/lipid kinase family protein [Erythrobacter litoralis]|uniref:diacylglycerol/lipid kinase family protein n=1 Tax=Erythrobacter litoralis TaxID=39960 RepID=UPI0024348273|nr:acylglycerol kinase family protein [Erythrobacter litoralis]